jgi:uncharacterized protein
MVTSQERQPTEQAMTRQVGENSQEMILLAGTSVRAAAESCRRAGLACLAIDKFADFDLRRACLPDGVFAVENWSELPAIAARLPRCPWMFTGPLENRPSIVEAVSKNRPLWGSSVDSLICVRDPAQLACVLQSLKLPFPKTSARGDDFGTLQIPAMPWISKSTGAAGGGHVQFISESTPVPNPYRIGEANRMIQAFIPGRSVSGLFCARKSHTQFYGMTQQWHKKDCLPAGSNLPLAPFAYLGSVGPVELSEVLAQQWKLIGHGIAEAFSLQGLFGVDAILHPGQNGTQIVVLEVNPRYTASVEVFERATNQSLIRDHIGCFVVPGEKAAPEFTSKPAKTHRSSSPVGQSVAGKGILYATQPMRIEERHIAALLKFNEVNKGTIVSDIPMAKTAIATGDPVVSVQTRGFDVDQVARDLGLPGGGALARISEWLTTN